MRRRSGGGSFSREEGGEQGFWPSYADMMSSTALILFFLMLLAYVQNLITGNDLQNTQEVLADTEQRLVVTSKEVEDAEEQLGRLTEELGSARETLESQREEIAGYAREILGQTETIKAQEELIGRQKDYLSAADRELKDMRAQMQTIAVLRLSILEQIRASILEVMGDGAQVSIGENGSIVLSESVLFDLGSYAVKPGSRAVLEKLADVFQRFLADGENARYVDSIIISGHTDITGTAGENRDLSTDRANSVLNFLLSCRQGELEPYAQYFCAAGYGATRPVADNGTEAGRAANRRIEISMILRDETVLDIVEKYLALELPETAAAGESGTEGTA